MNIPQVAPWTSLLIKVWCTIFLNSLQVYFTIILYTYWNRTDTTPFPIDGKHYCLQWKKENFDF